MSAPGPLVSVVVPVHEGERFLAAALDSVLAQDHAPLEVIVVDDGSTDRSAEIARSRDVRVVTQPNRGVAAARNAGLAEARGALIGFVDQDDLWKPGRLARQVAQLAAHPAAGYVVGRLEVVIEPGVPRPAWLRPEWDLAGEIAAQLGTMLARREAFDRVGGFDTAFRLADDSDWLARAKDLGVEALATDDVVLTYRIHERNASHRTADVRGEVLRAVRASVARQRASGPAPEPTGR